MVKTPRTTDPEPPVMLIREEITITLPEPVGLDPEAVRAWEKAWVGKEVVLRATRPDLGVNIVARPCYDPNLPLSWFNDPAHTVPERLSPLGSTQVIRACGRWYPFEIGFLLLHTPEGAR